MRVTFQALHQVLRTQSITPSEKKRQGSVRTNLQHPKAHIYRKVLTDRAELRHLS